MAEEARPCRVEFQEVVAEDLGPELLAAIDAVLVGKPEGEPRAMRLRRAAEVEEPGQKLRGLLHLAPDDEIRNRKLGGAAKSECTGEILGHGSASSVPLAGHAAGDKFLRHGHGLDADGENE
mgnify:CR=1 FL=1